MSISLAVRRTVKPDGMPVGRVSDDSAREALTDMPPRLEEELDAVTLHNQAIMNMEEKVTYCTTTPS